MKLKTEWDYLLDFKRKLFDWYNTKDIKNNLNIDTNIDTLSINKLFIDIKNNKNYGKFDYNIYFNICSDDKLIDYKMVFNFQYYLSYKDYFFFKKRKLELTTLNTKISGTFYGTGRIKKQSYNNIFELKTDLHIIEDLMLYLKDFYKIKKIM